MVINTLLTGVPMHTILLNYKQESDSGCCGNKHTNKGERVYCYIFLQTTQNISSEYVNSVENTA